MKPLNHSMCFHILSKAWHATSCCRIFDRARAFSMKIAWQRHEKEQSRTNNIKCSLCGASSDRRQPSRSARQSESGFATSMNGPGVKMPPLADPSIGLCSVPAGRSKPRRFVWNLRQHGLHAFLDAKRFEIESIG